MNDATLLKSEESCRTDGLIHRLFMETGGLLNTQHVSVGGKGEKFDRNTRLGMLVDSISSSAEYCDDKQASDFIIEVTHTHSGAQISQLDEQRKGNKHRLHV